MERRRYFSLVAWGSQLMPQSLSSRIFALYSLALTLFLGLGLGVFYFHQFEQRLEEWQITADMVTTITAQAIQESVVIGDYDAVRRTLEQALLRTPFHKIMFIDMTGARILLETSRGTGIHPPPSWLISIVAERLFDVNHNIVVGGHDYGVLRFNYDITKAADELWSLMTGAFWLAAGSLTAGLIVMRLLLRRWLKNLGRLQSFEEQIKAGNIEADMVLSGDAPLEIRQAFETITRTAASLRDQFGQRIDALMSALVQHKNALDQTAIVSEINGEGRIASVNDLYCTTLGIARDALIGIRPEDSMIEVGDDTDSSVRSMLSDDVWRGVVRMACADGNLLWLKRTVVPIFASESRIEKWVCIDVDITGQKAAEEKLWAAYHRSRQLAERHLQAILDTVGEGFVLIDGNQKLVICNQKFRQLYPGAATEIDSCATFGEILLAAFRAHGFNEETCRNRVVERLQAYRTEMGVPRIKQFEDGRWIREVEYPTQDNGVVAIYSDISEMIRLENDLRRAKEQAEAGSRAKSEFLAMMSHEIRTPLNGVMGMTSLLIDTPLSSDQKRFADTIRFSTESLLGIINDILDFSKVEAGRMEFEECPFEIGALVEGVIDVLAPRARSKKIDIAYMTPKESYGQLLGDAGRLRQVLLNLAGNAVKFTHVGGVSIVVVIENGAASNGARVSIRVSDTGIGISDVAKTRMFEMFSQADASTTRRFGGTGLGLAISKRIVESMGGVIGFDSQGNGSTFWFSVPLKLLTPHAATLRKEDAVQGLRVLIIDNCVIHRDVLVLQLQNWGVGVTACGGDADGALKLMEEASLRNEPYQFILINHSTFDANIVEVAARLHAKSKSDAAQMILLSSADHGELQQVGCSRYFRHVLSKPLRQNVLYGCLSGSSSAFALHHGVVSGNRQSAPLKQGRKLSVLVAEDNYVNQQVAAGLLAKLGHRADLANDGGEAAAMAEHGKYDLILMDMRMPNVDGLQATRMIRSLAGGKGSIPIIAMTANAMERDRKACLEAGMNDFLPKPTDIARLAEILARWSPSDVQFREFAAEQQNCSGSSCSNDAWTFPEQIAGIDLNAARKNTFDNAPLLHEILLEFVASHSDFVDRLNAAIAVCHWGDVQRLAHSMKGVSATIGALTLSKLVSRVETLDAKSDRSVLNDLLEQVEQAFKEVISGIRTLEPAIPLSSVEQKTEEKASDTVSLSEYHEVSVQLMSALGDANPEAGRFAEKIMILLAETGFSTIAAEVFRLTDNYDFDEALQKLLKLTEALEASSCAVCSV
ncbi:two-component system, sensor histidine kinase and response regulator [Azospirillaceae bacterium]